MRSFWTKITMPILVVSLTLAGCGGDDGTQPEPQPQIPPDAAAEEVPSLVELVSGLMIASQSVADGDLNSLSQVGGGSFVPRAPAAEPSFSLTFENGMWTASFSDVGDSHAVNVVHTVQYLDAAGSAQQEPDLTTASAHFSTSGDVSFEESATDETGISTLSIAASYDNATNIGGFQADALAVGSVGEQSLTANATSPQGNFHYMLTVDWTIDVAISRTTGCATGAATVGLDVYDLAITYNGDGSADWILKQGADTVASGSELVGCGVQ